MFSPQQCAGLQTSLQYNLNDLDRYNEFFTQNSSMTLAQAGVYMGPENIKEYFAFGGDHSPYIAWKEIEGLETQLVAFDPNIGSCTYLFFHNVHYDFDPEYTAGYSVTGGTMAKHVYSIPDNVVTDVFIHYTPELLDWFMGTALGEGDNANGYVCDVLASDGCRDVYELNGSPSRESCIEQLNSLDATEGELAYIDSQTRGCRYLHATFAQDNPDHCAHISFVPAQDPNGKIKCQESANMVVEELFSAAEIEQYETFCLGQGWSVSSGCFVVTGKPNVTKTDSPTMSPTDETSGTSFLGAASPIGSATALLLTIALIFTNA